MLCFERMPGTRPYPRGSILGSPMDYAGPCELAPCRSQVVASQMTQAFATPPFKPPPT